MDTLESLQETITQMPAWQIAVLLLALVFLVIGLRLVFKKPPAHLTAFSGDAGNVLVSRKALQELVRSACLLDEWVEAARPNIRVKNNKVTAQVELRLARADNLKMVCERVQAHITALLQKSLSFDQIGDIQIVVKSFGNDTSEGNELLEEADSHLAPESTLLTSPPQNAEDTPEKEEETPSSESKRKEQ